MSRRTQDASLSVTRQAMPERKQQKSRQDGGWWPDGSDVLIERNRGSDLANRNAVREAHATHQDKERSSRRDLRRRHLDGFLRDVQCCFEDPIKLQVLRGNPRDLARPVALVLAGRRTPTTDDAGLADAGRWPPILQINRRAGVAGAPARRYWRRPTAQSTVAFRSSPWCRSGERSAVTACRRASEIAQLQTGQFNSASLQYPSPIIQTPSGLLGYGHGSPEKSCTSGPSYPGKGPCRSRTAGVQLACSVTPTLRPGRRQQTASPS